MDLARDMASAVRVPNAEDVMRGSAWDEPSSISLELMQSMKTSTPRRGWVRVQALLTERVWKVAIPAALLVVIAGLGLVLARPRPPTLAPAHRTPCP
jgi:hypothetical protein